MKIRIYRNSEAHFHGLRDLEDLDVHYTNAWFEKLRDHGFNGLWIGEWLRRLVAFREPENAEQTSRLQALRRLIDRAARFDVGVYLFLNEPKAFPRGHRIWTRFPGMKGAPGTRPRPAIETFLICTSTPEGKAYVYENAKRLHGAVPGLAGTIHINASEMPTHCYCHTITNPNGKIFSSNQEHLGIDCSRCAARLPENVAAEILNLYRQGCRDAGCRAPIMAWNWNWIMWRPHPQEELMRRLHPEVMLMADFECGGKKSVYGREQPVNEYSLIFAGPSDGFQSAAACAARYGHGHCAKLQVGTTHEMGTLANLPLFGNLFRKLDYLNRSSCHGMMASYNFGCLLSMNTAAVGAFVRNGPFAAQNAFLAELCRGYLGCPNVQEFCAAVHAMESAFDSYPLTNPMVHRGPFSYAPAYPIDGVPLSGRRPAPSYSARGEFGDAWEESLGPYTLDEVINGLTRMTGRLQEAVAKFEQVLFPARRPWDTGLASHAGPPAVRKDSDVFSDAENVEYARRILPESVFRDMPELRGVSGLRRLQEWCNAWAMLGTVESAMRIFLNHRAKVEKISGYDRFLQTLQKDEIENLKRCLPVYRLDARLGYHIEAHAYLVNADMIERKLAQLERPRGRNEQP